MVGRQLKGEEKRSFKYVRMEKTILFLFTKSGLHLPIDQERKRVSL
jgi:hypothetical protein